LPVFTIRIRTDTWQVPLSTPDYSDWYRSFRFSNRTSVSTLPATIAQTTTRLYVQGKKWT